MNRAARQPVNSKAHPRDGYDCIMLWTPMVLQDCLIITRPIGGDRPKPVSSAIRVVGQFLGRKNRQSWFELPSQLHIEPLLAKDVAVRGDRPLSTPDSSAITCQRG